ncbi:MAG TPA: hypothetical protein VIW80_06135 [Pyrinomonadaceae bacterium]|jgi:hypothetical protein
MRRQLLFVGILLCALTLSGWGSVASVALCPHAVRATAAAAEVMKMDDDHACCPSKDAVADEHCSGEAAGEMEAMPGMTSNEPGGLARIDESCRHCVSHNSVPTAPFSMRESQRNGSEDSRPASHEVKALAPPAAKFLSVIIPVQGAPPGQPNRKHLLLRVFLI